MESLRARFLPSARSENIVTKEVDGELLVYDRERDAAHCLNKSATAIWKLCDGTTTPSEIAKSLASQTVDVDESAVWLGLDELRRNHLLANTEKWSSIGIKTPRVSRRTIIKRIGLTAAVALPAIISITAPTPAQAATCKGAGANCGTSSQCCSGVCSGGSCLGGPVSNPAGRQERRR